jgi:mono/diheme cytochrome c family protein
MRIILFSSLMLVISSTAWATPAETFAVACAACHGAAGAGDGDGAAAPGLPLKPANFTAPEFWEGETDEHIARVFKEGGASVGKSPMMGAFGGMFDDVSMKEMVAYLRTLEKK